MTLRNKLCALATAAFLTFPAATATAQSEGTVGDCISDNLYGNEPNMANGAPGGPEEQVPGTQAGNVLPTQSPGPWVNNPSDPDNPFEGPSVGEIHQTFGPGVYPEFCRTIYTQ